MPWKARRHFPAPMGSTGHFHTRTWYKSLVKFEQTSWPCLLLICMLDQIFHGIQGPFRIWFQPIFLVLSLFLSCSPSIHVTVKSYTQIAYTCPYFCLYFLLGKILLPMKFFGIYLSLLHSHNLTHSPVSPGSLKAKLSLTESMCCTRPDTCLEYTRHLQ